ncbi:DUF6069 family protein [Halorubrum sp. AD140]|uniref:DUF6069 family protein n=1 Tax=Halorubrum sp. AD140 TaxID=3050073 RepID=UPI002ACC8CA0|nr:DUF6069 family protein [Halorubrum sp. AD140]MDZ5812564.1 DUF6069 family protein [Halorubrum sp. AD140]
MTTAEHTMTRSPSVPVRGGLAVVLAVLANVGLVLGVDALGIAPEFQALTIPPVAFLSALGAGGATVVYWLLGRYVNDADRTFVRVAAGVLLLSFVPDVALLAIDPAATPLAVVVLMAMHVVVAVVSVWVLVSWRTGQ